MLNNACSRELDLGAGESILDVGSGIGQFTRVMAQLAGGNGRALGVELDKAQLVEANRRLKDDNQPQMVEFRQGDALDLPLRSREWGSFDLAHARFLLEHISDPVSVVTQMVQAVRPGGRVVLADDDHGDFRPWPLPAGFDAIWHAYVSLYERKGNDPYIGRRLVSLLHNAGLRSIRNTTIFFGGCAGNEAFDAVADNLISTLRGARDEIISSTLLDEELYLSSIDSLRQWKQDPSAALWYSVCWAQGEVPLQAN